jgi:3-deoxy-D-manno-octulosonate 8-phosphate phosphatase (KDO 8-P phosphatase)
MSQPLARPGAAGKAGKVRILLLDVDGVLSDGGIAYDGEGREIKRFHVRDGHGVKLMQRAGIEVGIISGRHSDAVSVRAKELGISLVRQGTFDKVAAWKEILSERGLSAGETAYVGDDLVDLPLLRKVGFSASVADAEESVRSAADYVASRTGGHGAVREIIEFILRSGGHWERVVGKYFRDGEDE